jgi:hypothetical protein
MSTQIENTPDEQQLERLLETVPPEMGERVNSRLASAPWTPRAASRQRMTWIITSAFAAILLLFFASPPGRAWAQDVLHFFTRADRNSLPWVYTPEPQTWVDVTPGMQAPTLTPRPTMAAFTAECGDYPEARCSVEQIRNLVAFTVTELGTIPPGLYFTGATGGPSSIMLGYSNQANTEGVTLFESPWTGSPEQTSWPVGPGAEVKTVDIKGIPGEYVSGSFLSNSGGPVNWDPTFDMQTLHWVQNEVFIEMQYFGAGGKVGLTGMVDLAASLTARPVSALLPMPATSTPDVIDFSKYYPLTVAQAEQLAGFQIRLPGRTPTVLLPEPVGARFDNPSGDPNMMYGGYHVLTMVYPVNPAAFADPRGMNGMLLHEELLSDPTGCALCGFRVGTDADVDADTDHTGAVVGGLETVQIGNVEGQLAIGVWSGRNNNGIWSWDNTFGWPIRLRWQADGMAYELEYYGSEIEKADLIAIAESIK